MSILAGLGDAVPLQSDSGLDCPSGFGSLSRLLTLSTSCRPILLCPRLSIPCREQSLPLKPFVISSILSLPYQDDAFESWLGDSWFHSLLNDANKPRLDEGFVFLSESSAKVASHGGPGLQVLGC